MTRLWILSKEVLMPANRVWPVTQKSEQTEDGEGEKQKVVLSTLSAMTGLPTDFLKSELLLESDYCSLGELRQKVLHYIDQCSQRH